MSVNVPLGWRRTNKCWQVDDASGKSEREKERKVKGDERVKGGRERARERSIYIFTGELYRKNLMGYI